MRNHPELSTEEYELLSLCESLLSKRESSPPYVHWVINKDGYDEEGDFCPECVIGELVRVVTEQGRVDEDDDDTRTIYEYPATEDDGCRHCETCGALLDYTLTNYGVENELDHFSDADSVWDWNDADACFELSRVINGAWTLQQHQKLLAVVVRGQNPPPELAAVLAS